MAKERINSESISRRDFLKVAGAALGGLAFRSKIDFPNISGVEINPVITDVLDAKTQYELAAKAQDYVCHTPERAQKMANYLRNSTRSSADNICGPLAMTQLIHSVNYGVRPEDYWLADSPASANGIKLFAEAFPPSKFDEFATKTALGDYDFNFGPGVEPGDFFFFRARPGHDGFSHMMTISRRGSNGVLYAITNYPDENKKWIIKEVPFWNPGDPEGSWVKELAKGDNSQKFASGDGGFFQWRLKRFGTPAYEIIEHSGKAEALQGQIETMARGAVGDWHVLIKNMTTGNIIAESGARVEGEVASIIKVPVAMALIAELESEAKNEEDLVNILKGSQYRGKTFEELMKKMIVHSDETATGYIREYLGKMGRDVEALARHWGGEVTSITDRTSNATDMSEFFGHIYDFKTFKYPSSHRYLLELLREGGTDRSGSIGNLPALGVKVNMSNGMDNIYNKIGLLTENGGSTIVANSAIVEVVKPEGGIMPVFISFAGTKRRGNELKSIVLYNIMESELRAFIKTFADFIIDKKATAAQ